MTGPIAASSIPINKAAKILLAGIGHVLHCIFWHFRVAS